MSHDFETTREQQRTCSFVVLRLFWINKWTMLQKGFLAVLVIGWSLPSVLPVDIFDKIPSLDNRTFNTTLTTTVTTQEMVQLECAARCAERVNCTWFMYGTNSGDCTMLIHNASGDTVPAGEPTVFYKKRGPCPILETGYGYDETADVCFFVSSVSVSSWDAAIAACQTMGMQLAILDTPAKQAAVMETLRARPELQPSTRYIYIGGARPKAWWGNTSTPDDYFWLDGSPVEWHDSQYWGRGQPNGYGFEECLGIYVSGFVIYDRRPTDVSAYLCLM